MKFGEVLKVLRYVRDVLAEYLATEQRKRDDATRRAAEAVRRKAEEAVAREAEMQAAQERLLARPTKPTGRRRSRRGEGPIESTPVRTMQLPPVTDAIFNVSEGPRPRSSGGPHGLPQGFPPGLVALITQLQQLDAAIKNLFTVTDGTRAWFVKVQSDPRWGPVVGGLSMALSMLAQRISSRLYHRDVSMAHHRKVVDNCERIDRMLKGDWKEKIRYMLWTNGQRKDRAALAAQAEAPAPVALLSASGWG